MVRLEWIHALAGLERWKEHITLTKEELRRVTVYFAAVERRWGAQKPPATYQFADKQMEAGYQAYANRQAQVYATLSSSALDLYRSVVPPQSSIV